MFIYCIHTFFHIATIYAKVGVKVTIFCASEKLLTFLQPSSLSAIKARLAADGVDMVYDDIANIQATNDTVKVTLANTTTIKVDKLLYVQGTDGNSEGKGSIQTMITRAN